MLLIILATSVPFCVQVELLLDAYAIDFVSMAKQLSLMSKEIDATEDFLRFKLDKARNRLILLDVMFGMVGMWLAANAVFSSYYGMNLPNGAYTDGSVKPGQPFVPPGGGTSYDGPFGGTRPATAASPTGVLEVRGCHVKRVPPRTPVFAIAVICG